MGSDGMPSAPQDTRTLLHGRPYVLFGMCGWCKSTSFAMSNILSHVVDELSAFIRVMTANL
jgi:hypothetical protein